MPTLLDQRPAPRYDPVGDEVARRRAEQELLMRQRQQAMGIDAEQATRARQSAPLDLQAKQQAIDVAAEKARLEKQTRTASGDFIQWHGNDSPVRGKSYGELDPYSQAGLVRAYPDIAGQIPGLYDQAGAEATGKIPGIQLKAGQSVTQGPGGITRQEHPLPIETFDPSKPRATYDPNTGETKVINAGPQEPQFDQFTTPQEVMGQLPASESGMAQQLADYKIPITALSRMPADMRMRVLNAAKVFNPDFDVKEYNNLNNARKAYTTGTQGQNITAINTAIGHLGQLSKLSKGLDNVSFPLVGETYNDIKNNLSRRSGNPAITQFEQTKEAVASELAKVFKGSGVTSEAQMREWRNAINSSMSPDQLKAAISNAVHLMGSRVQELDRQWGQLTRAPKDYRVLSDNNKRILSEIGFDPSELDPTGETQPQNGTQPATQAPAAPQQSEQAPQVNSQAEYDALPAGAKYRDSNGRTATKH